MSFARKELGKSGEDLALSYLEKKGYLLVGQNVRLFCGEIDILMQDKKTLVIVEVKTKSNSNSSLPVEKVDRHKQNKLRQLAKALSQKFPDRLLRIDVVGIDEASGKIDHIINAVEGV